MMGENDYLIRSDGQIYPLRHYGVKVTGLGNVPLEHMTQAGYKQHGVVVSGWRLTPRTITFALDLDVLRPDQRWQRRQELIDQISPQYGAVTYRKVFADGSRRDIDGMLDTSLSLVESDDLRHVATGFGLFCPDPTFYDPAEQDQILTAATVDAFVLPFAVPDELWFGGATQLSGTVSNPGTWRAYPVITIGGPYSRMIIQNQTTGASITLGVALPAGSSMVIDLTPGQETITRDGDNAFDEIEEGNLIDWYLAPGDNLVLFGGAGVTVSSFARVSFQARYIAL